MNHPAPQDREPNKWEIAGWRPHPSNPGGNRGASRHLRELRQLEADIRNAHTDHIRTKAHRLGRCLCHQDD